MASFTGQLIKDTYDSILKAIDNGVIDSTAKNITDGVGNVTPLYISTTQVGIGVTPSTDFHVNGSALIGGSLTITGDLTVNGSTTTISTQTLSVEDPLIILAKDNAANSVDIGFYGKYVDGSTKYAGLFRKAGDNKFHIFSGLGTEPTTTVNTSDASYVISTLVGNLEGNVTGNIIATGAGATQIMSDVRAVTQSANDNSTKIATTAYVDSALGGQDTLAEILANGNTTGGTDISVSANDDITFTDSSKAIFDGNLKIYNDGNYNYIHCTSNELRIRSNNLRLLNSAGTANYITADNLQAVQLYYNNSKKLETTSTGVTVTGAVSATTFSGQLDGTISSATTAVTQSDGDNSTKVATTAYVDTAIQGHDTLAEVLVGGNTTGGTDIAVSSGDNITFADSSQAIFGAGSDLKIFSDGSGGYIRGVTAIQSQDGTDDFLSTAANAGVSLFYNNSKKFETTSSGIEVTGDGIFGGSSFDDPNSYGRKIEIVDNDAVGLILNDTRDTNPMSIDNSGAVMNLRYNTTSMLALDGATSNATFAGDVIVPEYIKHSGDEDTSIRFTTNNIKFYTANNEVLELEDDGQVNIISAGTVTNPCLTIGDDVNTGIWRPASDTFAISTGGNERMRIDSGGDVGIGVNSPSTKLEVLSSQSNSSIRTGGLEMQSYAVNNSWYAENLYYDGAWKLRSNGHATQMYMEAGVISFKRVASGSAGDSVSPLTTMVLNSDGNVGIGTSSPANKLNVVQGTSTWEAVEIQSSSTTGCGVTLVGADTSVQWSMIANASTGGAGANNLGFHLTGAGSSGGSTGYKMTIQASSGNVGIGTTSPSYKLHISGGDVFTSADKGYIASYNNTTSYYGALRWAALQLGNNGGNRIIAGRTATGGVLDFYTNNTNDASDYSVTPDGTHVMRMAANGNVGIGTTSPSRELDIQASSGWAEIALRGNTGAGGSLEFWTTTTKRAEIFADTEDIVFRNTASNTERMRIDSSGNLSLATATSLDFNVADFAQIKFKESGAITIDSDNNQSSRNFQFKDGDGSSLMFIGDDGNVGIGTTSPRNDANFVTLQVGSTATAASQIVLDDNDSNGPWRIISNQSLIINDDATERMRIESDGTVQITNSTSPKLQLKRGTKEYTTRVDNNNKFVIQEEGGNEFFVVESGASSNSIRIDSSGNVGIGTTNPQNKFVVKEGSNVDMEFGSESSGCFIQTYNRTSSTWGYLRFIAGGGERMRITQSGGEVLINQTSDLTGQIFQVNGMIDQTDVTKALRVYNGSTFLGGIGSGQWAISATYANDYALYAQNNLLFHAGTGSSIDMMIDANHNVGIATTSPSAKLHVNGVITANDTIQVQGDDSGFVCKNAAGTVIGTIGAVSSSTTNIGMFTVRNNGNNRIVLHANGSSYFNGGNVGIGTTSPSAPLTVHGQQKWYTTSADGNELRGFFNPGGSGDDAELSLYIADGATEGIVWRAAGNSYIRIDSTSLKFINFYYGSSNVGQIVTGGTNVLYQSNSDYRLKENVVEMTGALDRVEQLKPSTYNFISQPETQVDGFMAHELQEVVPQAVSGEKDEMNEDGTPKYQGVDHSQIVPLLVGAIKELKAEIETLKAQINN